MYVDLTALKEAAPIIPFVKKRYPNLIESETGGIASCLCPWHKEKTPSLKLFPNGTFKCFGECGMHGDVINFVQNMENLLFEEACKAIGDEVGFEVNFEPQNSYHESYKNQMDNHARRYWYNLQMNTKAIDYLDKRGIKKETRDLFRLGLTDWQEYKYRKDIGGIQGRISFPILENKVVKPKCVGMMYRTLEEKVKPKYINDKNQDGLDGKDPNLTGVFIKGNCLYGYSQAYDAIKKSGYAILTEGPMDVISAFQSNVKNVVASLGTSVTSAQIQLLSKITKNILLILDGDAAGISAALRVLPMILSHGMNVNICILPGGKDLGELCFSYNFSEMPIKQIIKSYSTPAIQYLINEEVKQYENFVIKERTKAMSKLSEVLNLIQDQTTKDIYTDMAYKRLDVRR